MEMMDDAYAAAAPPDADPEIGLSEHNPRLLRRQSSNYREYRSNISTLERQISIEVVKRWCINLV